MPEVDPLSLPVTLRAIASVRSAHTRFMLTGHIFNIIQLSKESQSHMASVSLKAMVDRFFTYAVASCKTKQIINQRSKWLVIYAQCIEDHLLLFLKKYKETAVPGDIEPLSALMIKICVLVKTIALHRCHRPSEGHVDQDLFLILDKIIDIASCVKEVTDNQPYVDLLSFLEDDIQILTLIQVTGLMGVEQDLMIYRRCSEIYQRLQHYVLKRPM